jgi:hypothetical protein
MQYEVLPLLLPNWQPAIYGTISTTAIIPLMLLLWSPLHLYIYSATNNHQLLKISSLYEMQICYLCGCWCYKQPHLKAKKYDTIFLCCLLGLYMTPHHISDVILMSHSPMKWTCAQHIRHGKSCPGHTKLQKIYLWVRCTKFMSKM